MKVYVISDGCIDDRHVVGVTLDENQAARICDYNNEHGSRGYCDYEEYDVDEFRQFARGYLPYRVIYNGHEYFAKETSLDIFTPNRIFKRKTRGEIVCNVWARHSEEAKQLAERLIHDGVQGFGTC